MDYTVFFFLALLQSQSASVPAAQGEAKLYQNQLQLFIGPILSLYSKHESVQTAFQGLQMTADLLSLSLQVNTLRSFSSAKNTIITHKSCAPTPAQPPHCQDLYVINAAKSIIELQRSNPLILFVTVFRDISFRARPVVGGVSRLAGWRFPTRS